MAGYLTFQLYGMLAAYGLIAVGEVRPSAPHPTRSAVFGLLAACLGIRRGEEQRLRALSAGYALAVRVDAPGTPLLDYHTVQTPPEKSKRVYRTRADELGGLLGRDEEPYTVLSRRGYLCDAHFTAALTPRDGAPCPLETLAAVLRRPLLTPYLGRKSCPPSLPFDPRVGEYASMAEAFDAYPLDGGVVRDAWKRPAKILVFADEDAGLADVAQRVLVRDRAIRHDRRQFAERREAMAELPAGRIGKRRDGHVSQ
jgi:CRISPR system Cascade subunit CasD